MNSSIHRVKKIEINTDTENVWTTIKVISGKNNESFELTLFADGDDLENLALNNTYTGLKND